MFDVYEKKPHLSMNSMSLTNENPVAFSKPEKAAVILLVKVFIQSHKFWYIPFETRIILFDQQEQIPLELSCIICQ